MKIFWNFLRRSLEEAHRELRTMQEGGSVEHVQINAELRSLLQRTFRIEKGSFEALFDLSLIRTVFINLR